MKSRYIRPSETSVTARGHAGRIDGRDGADEIAHRHGGEEVVAGKGDALPACIDPFDSGHPIAGHVDAVDLDAEVNFAAGLDDQVRDVFPKLAGAELGVQELLDERGFGLFLSDVLCWTCGGRPC